MFTWKRRWNTKMGFRSSWWELFYEDYYVGAAAPVYANRSYSKVEPTHYEWDASSLHPTFRFQSRFNSEVDTLQKAKDALFKYVNGQREQLEDKHDSLVPRDIKKSDFLTGLRKLASEWTANENSYHGESEVVRNECAVALQKLIDEETK